MIHRKLQNVVYMKKVDVKKKKKKKKKVSNIGSCPQVPVLTMYLKYHKAGLTVKMSIGRKSLTNLRSEMKVGHVRPISAFRPFSGFIIYNH